MRIYWFGDYKFLFSFYLCIISFIYCLYLLFGYQGCHQGNVLLYSAPSSLPILFRCFLQLLCIICPPNVRGKSSFVGIFHVPYWIIGQNMRICKKVIHVKYFQTICILYIYFLDIIYHISSWFLIFYLGGYYINYLIQIHLHNQEVAIHNLWTMWMIKADQ